MEKLHAVQRGSSHASIADRLRAAIVEGELAPGERMPERVLRERYGATRTPLREALKVLAAEGLVELLPNCGARVTRIDETDLAGMFEVMAALEALSGALAAVRIDEAQIAEARALHHEMLAYYHRRDRREYFRCNEAIHDLILRAASNVALTAAYRTVSVQVRRARYNANLSAARWAQAVEEHEAIVEALARHDAAALGKMLREHVEHKWVALRLALAAERETIPA